MRVYFNSEFPKIITCKPNKTKRVSKIKSCNGDIAKYRDEGWKPGDNNFQRLTSVQVKKLLKGWWQTVSQIPHKVDSADYMYSSINALKEYSENNYSNLDLYLAWSPKIENPESTLQGYIDSYYLTACKINPVEHKLEIMLIAQNPIYRYLDPVEVPSIRFKKEITQVAEKARTIADFEELFKSDPRYKLSWTYFND